MENKSLDVYYHDSHVGTLAEMPDRRIAFQYSDEWLKRGFSISPLSLPLKNTVFIPPEKSRDIFGGLFGVFADSLPDNWGRLLLDRYLISKGIRTDSVSTLERLAYIGKSGMGALEYYPSKEADFNVNTVGINFDEIAAECNSLLSSKTSAQLDLLYKIAGSSGGTRPKILITENERYWIIKFPAREDAAISGKREYDYSVCAKKCGIIMTKTELVKSAVCDGYFKTERFDRYKDEKIHTVSFAGLLETDFRAPTCDYSTYMKLVQVLTKDNNTDKEQLFKIMCFNVLAHNLDDHSKNFSALYTDQKGWRLAPAYDLTYSDTYYGEQTTSVNGKGKNIKESELIQIGTDSGMTKKRCSECLEYIKEQLHSLDIYLRSNNFTKNQASILDKISDVKNNI